MQITRSLRISPSSMVLFFKCSMQYKWAILEERIPDPGSDNLYAVLGTTLHKAMELHDKYQIDYDKLRTTWRVLFLSSLMDAKDLPEGLEIEHFISKGFTLLRNAFALKERWKEWKVVNNEFYARLPYTNSFIENVFLSGRIDLIVSKLPEYAAIDWKTSSRLLNADEDIQMTFYILFLHSIYKVDFSQLWGAFAFPALKKVIFTQRTEQDIINLYCKIDEMLSRISRQDFAREPKINKCKNDCTFCPYQVSCDKI